MSQSEIENETETSEVAFFWISQKTNEDVVECASDITEFTSLISNPIITCRVSTVPIQNISTVHHSSPICDAFMTILTILVCIAPPLISKMHTTSPPRRFSIRKTKVPQTKQQFSGTCVIKSRQLRLKDQLSRSRKRVSRQFATKALPCKSFRSVKDSFCSWKCRKKKRHRIMSLSPSLTDVLL